jgi:hypothetical protein
MKKTLLTLTFVLATLFSNAQVQLGIKAGVNIADISELKTSKKTSFYGGLVLNIKTSNKYTLQPELLYSKQGATLSDDDNTLDGVTNDIQLDYFSIGIINKFYVAKHAHIIIGPSIDIRAYKNFTRNDFNDLLPPVDISFIGGLGFDVTPNLSVEARYKQGVVDILDYYDIFENTESTSNIETRNLNEVFQLGVVYKFDFK